MKKEAIKISDIGEDAFIEKVKKEVNLIFADRVVEGIGDDCAVVQGGEGLTLLTTDSLVEGCHFIKDKISARDLGYKGVMVNVSDIAAMGGSAQYVLMSIALPNDTEEVWINEYLEGVNEACQEAGVELVGGDTTCSKGGIFINFCVMGEVLEECVKYRSGARVGDVICITDPIGGSLAGYELMMAGVQEGELVEKHCRPRALDLEGEWLGEQVAVKAMMDVSDGLVQDLRRMMKASKVAARVDLEKIPMSDAFRQFASKTGRSAEELAIGSGEEYCLLLAVDAKGLKQLQKGFKEEFDRDLYEIGVVEKGKGVSFFKDGKKIEVKSEGYLHFQVSKEV